MGGVSELVSSGPLLLAIPVAAAAGAITFLSPCVLPLVPGYLSYVTGMSGTDAQRRQRAGTAGPAAAPADGAAASAATVAVSPAAGAGQGRVTTALTAPGPTATAVRGAAGTGAPGSGPALAARAPRGRTVVGTALFVLGFALLYASYGAAAGGIGVILKLHQTGLEQVLGAVTIVLGLLFAGALDRLPVAGRIARPSFRPRVGLAGAPLLGLMFGLGWTPCIGPTLLAVLSIASTTGGADRGAILAFVYSLGLGIPFLLVALAFQRGMTALAFLRRHGRLVSRIGGGMLVVVGVLEVTGAWSAAITWVQLHWASPNLPL